jgi:hypothetical protein
MYDPQAVNEDFVFTEFTDGTKCRNVKCRPRFHEKDVDSSGDMTHIVNRLA